MSTPSICPAARRCWSLVPLLLVACGVCEAHDVPPSTISLDIGRHTIRVDVQLPLAELASASQLPLELQPATLVRDFEPAIERYLTSHLRAYAHDGETYPLHVQSMSIRQTQNPNWVGNQWLDVTLSFEAPVGQSTEYVDLYSSVIIDRVISHQALILVRHDVRNGVLGDQPVPVGVLAFGTSHVIIDGTGGSWWKGFMHLFQMGMRHIGEGPDHLLFLIALLLPAPLVASSQRWHRGRGIRQSLRRVVQIVSGFTAGHSITLALSAAGLISLPVQLVEVTIAASILVSAAHAWRPTFPGREMLVAAAFGLIHGLSFAEVLRGLNFDATSLVVSLAAFNIGIEVMQLLVVASLLPLLLLWSRYAHYHVFRVASAVFAAVCAGGWIAERALGLNNPLAPIMALLAPPPAWAIVLVCCSSILAVSTGAAMAFRRKAPSGGGQPRAWQTTQ